MNFASLKSQFSPQCNEADCEDDDGGADAGEGGASHSKIADQLTHWKGEKNHSEF